MTPDDRRVGNLWPVLAYTAIAVVMTWPLVTRLGHEIASDLGDPVFNSWVMMWTGGQVLAALGGHWNALHLYWHGNIFTPEPLTIAYSEHLTPQSEVRDAAADEVIGRVDDLQSFSVSLPAYGARFLLLEPQAEED